MSHQLRRLYRRPAEAGKPKRAWEAKRKCGEKLCYEKAEAQYYAYRRGLLIDRRLRTYPCPICRYWHLTKRNPGKEKKSDRDPKRYKVRQPLNPTRELMERYKGK